MDIRALRKTSGETTQSLGRLGFQLLLASASARQASSRTARAVVLQELTQVDEEEGQPDQTRIRILSNKQQTSRTQQQRLARFSDITLPQPCSTGIAANGDDEATT